MGAIAAYQEALKTSHKLYIQQDSPKAEKVKALIHHYQIFAIFNANNGISGSQLTDSGLSKISGG